MISGVATATTPTATAPLLPKLTRVPFDTTGNRSVTTCEQPWAEAKVKTEATTAAKVRAIRSRTFIAVTSKLDHYPLTQLLDKSNTLGIIKGVGNGALR